MSLPPATGAVELESFIQHTVRLFSQRRRADGRSFGAVRLPTAQRVPTAGALSAVLWTDAAGACVSCAVTGAFAPPPPARPDEGRLTVHVSAPFLAAPPAALGESLGDVAHFVRRALGACVDLAALGVRRGEACWLLRAEIAVLSADGGIRAAALHAAVAALWGLALPDARLPDGDRAVGRALRFRAQPVAATCAFVTDAETGEMCAVADPNAAEEAAADGLATIVLDEAGGIVEMVHSGRCPIASQTLMQLVEKMTPQVETIRSAIFDPQEKTTNNS